MPAAHTHGAADARADGYPGRGKPTPAAPPDPARAALPPATLEFAHRMFDAARNGDADLLLQAVDAGLPPNLTNEKGTRPPSKHLPTPHRP